VRHSHVPSRRSAFSRAFTPAFTLVELLVVIGVIAIVIALVFPSFARAREQARRVQCASNIRQVTMATLMYAGQNGGVMPQPANLPARRYDWIYWGGGPKNLDLSESMIAPYLGRPVNPAVLRCPSDAWEDRAAWPTPYLYSYTINRFMSSIGPESVVRTQPETMRLQRVRMSSEKILFVEEDVSTMEDGMWLDGSPAPGGGRYVEFPDRAGNDPNDLNTAVGHFLWEPISPRHDVRRKGAFGSLEWRGNVAFVDGHVDYVTERFTRDKRHVLPEE